MADLTVGENVDVFVSVGCSERQGAHGLRLAFVVGLLLFALKPLLSQGMRATRRDQLTADAQNKIRALSGQFAEIIGPTDRDIKLWADCNINCTAVADVATGKTVSEGLDDSTAATQAGLDRVIGQIQTCVDDYIARSFRTSGADLNPVSIAKSLGTVLQDEAVEPPIAFLLHSPKGNALLVFYQLSEGMWSKSATVLRAYAAVGGRLRLSDSIGSDFDDYMSLKIKELHSPEPAAIWLYVSGQVAGANGPNIRMRVFAYDGKKFRAMWVPANHWGDFRMRVTQDGFRVDGDYYHSRKHRHEAYILTPDGLHLEVPSEM